MGDEITHRSAHVASVAFKLALDGSRFSAGRLKTHLEKESELENVPSKGTIQKIMKQLREDGILEKGVNGVSEPSKKLRANGDYVPKEKIDAEALADEIGNEIEIKAEKAVLDSISEVERYYSNRHNKWIKKDK